MFLSHSLRKFDHYIKAQWSFETRVCFPDGWLAGSEGSLPEAIGSSPFGKSSPRVVVVPLHACALSRLDSAGSLPVTQVSSSQGIVRRRSFIRSRCGLTLPR